MALGWFSGAAEPDRPDFRAVLDVLRDAHTWQWRDLGLSEPHTSSMNWGRVLVLMVELPWVGAGYRNLQVGYAGSSAECGWGDEWVLDGFVDGVDLDEPSLSPSQMGERVGWWLVEQLKRPVVRDEWCARSGQVKASAWRLSDRNIALGGTGSWWRRSFTRPMTTVQAGPPAHPRHMSSDR